MSGYLQNFIVEYLRHAGPRPIDALYDAAEREHHASRDS